MLPRPRFVKLERVAQDSGQFLATRNIRAPHTQNLRTVGKRPCGNFVDNAIGLGVVVFDEFHRATVFVDESGDDGVNIDQQRMDATGCRGTCSVRNIGGGAPFPTALVKQYT